MQTLNVALGERGYPIHIGPGLLARTDLLAPVVRARKAAIVTNETVAPLYLERVNQSLGAAGISATAIVLPDGESFKNWETLNRIFDGLLLERCDRRTPLIALGGGLYVYHCATAPVPMHIANGMYGLILVEPPEGLPKVDHEYYVMEGDFYTQGKYHEKGMQLFDMEKAIDERPTYILFNGAEGSLVGEKALKAKVGETVRLYFGVGGPNITSSFHVIGEIFDRVYQEGGGRYQQQVQTTMVPAGGSAIMEYTVNVPGTYILVDHSLTRTFNKGALGTMKVEGPEDKALYSGKQADNTYGGSLGTPPIEANADPMAHGKEVYNGTCALCHQVDGAGVPSVFPPLAGSEYVNGDPARLIDIPLHGISGKITVKGKEYNAAMPPLATLTDEEIAHALTYVRASWGNKAGPITVDAVKAAREAKAK